jgi:cell division protein FtsL
LHRFQYDTRFTATAATNTIAMTTLQKLFITAALVAVAGTGLYEVRRLRAQIQTLQQQQTPLAEQVQQLQRERDDARSQLESLLVQNERLKTNQNTGELLKLRREVATLRVQARELAQLKSPGTQNTGDPTESAAKDLVGRMHLLKQRLDQMPDKNIPELQYLDTEAWARIAQTATLDTDAGVREALSVLRNLAKEKFAPQIGKALQAYAQANGGQLPTDASQLKPYFEVPVDDAALARYQMTVTGNVRDLQPGQLIVAERAAVDDEYDYLFQVGLNSQSSRGVGQNGNISTTTTRTPASP